MTLRSLIVCLAVGLAACGGDKKKTKPTPPEAVTRIGVSVGSTDVRACEVLVEDRDAAVNSVVFEPVVEGRTQRFAPRTAIAFTATSDAPLSGKLAELELSAATASTPFDVLTTRCFDREGRLVDSPDLRLE